MEFCDPDGHVLEIYWDIDQVGLAQDSRPADQWRPAVSLEDAIDNAPPGQDVTLADTSLRR